jgi:hypothetical protein
MTGEENIVAAAALIGIPVDEARKLTKKRVGFAEPVRRRAPVVLLRAACPLGLFSVAINVSPISCRR